MPFLSHCHDGASSASVPASNSESQEPKPPSARPITVVAYYLGQFHPTSENDEFWGPGFTEWHNVAKARPLFPGHQQPQLPGKFGFYDLRCLDTLAEQIAYSHEIGVNAFCHWHYWFAGKRVLHRPLDAMLELNIPEYKFMLGWANESWSGIWHGDADRVLIKQTYNRNELTEHARLIAGYIHTERYLELKGRFPFVVYKPKQIPSAAEYLSELKRLVRQFSGAELYIIGNWTPGFSGSFVLPSDYGLDAAVVTPVAALFRTQIAQAAYSAFWQAARRFGLGPEIRRYKKIVSVLRSGLKMIRGTSHATIVTGWDNTPRSGRRGLVLAGYNEHNFRQAAWDAVNLELRNETPLLFVKSWNEWAECNVIEPLYNETWCAGAALKEILSDRLSVGTYAPLPVMDEVLSDR